MNLRLTILFISDNTYIESYLKKIIASCEQFISTYRWLGGLLTNCRRVLLIISILKLKRYNVFLSKLLLFYSYSKNKKLKLKLKSKKKRFRLKLKFYKTLLNKRKKYLIVLRKYRRYDHIISGFSGLDGIPHFVVILNGVKSKWAVNEARASGIPSAAFIDSISQLNNKKLHYLIPINTSSFGVQSMLCGLFSSQVNLSSYYSLLLFGKFQRKLRKLNLINNNRFNNRSNYNNNRSNYNNNRPNYNNRFNNRSNYNNNKPNYNNNKLNYNNNRPNYNNNKFYDKKI